MGWSTTKEQIIYRNLLQAGTDLILMDLGGENCFKNGKSPGMDALFISTSSYLSLAHSPINVAASWD